jgi:hypothetical protein
VQRFVPIREDEMQATGPLAGRRAAKKPRIALAARTGAR